MTVFMKTIEVESTGGQPTFANITEEVRDAVQNSGIQNGTCTVVTIHTTCSVFYEEFVHDIEESGLESLQVDLENGLQKLFPRHTDASTYHYPGEEHYAAVASWPNAASYLPNGDRKALWNGDAHLKATLLGSSETFAVEDGALWAGKTGYVYFVDFDITRPRRRKIKIVVMGE